MTRPSQFRHGQKLQFDKSSPLWALALIAILLQIISSFSYRQNSFGSFLVEIQGRSEHNITAVNAAATTEIQTTRETLATTIPTLSKGKSKLKLSFPIFVLSLPKSGTSSTWKYFSCGNISSMHHYSKSDDGNVIRAGYCLGENVKHGRPMLQGCGNYSLWSDAGIPHPIGRCFYPSTDGLENILKYYPNATLVVGMRNAVDWTNSVMDWRGMTGRWKRNCVGFPDRRATEPMDWVKFYFQHTDRIRKFAHEHPSLRYIEFSLESPFTGQLLEERTGIPASCWPKEGKWTKNIK